MFDYIVFGFEKGPFKHYFLLMLKITKKYIHSSLSLYSNHCSIIFLRCHGSYTNWYALTRNFVVSVLDVYLEDIKTRYSILHYIELYYSGDQNKQSWELLSSIFKIKNR